MKIVQGVENLKSEPLAPVVALGNFDGVHLAHQEIFRVAVERAKIFGGTPAAFTFDPHPLTVIAPEKAPLLLTPFEKKAALMERLGLELLAVEKFTPDFAEQSPEDFFKNVLADKLGARELVAGYDYAFGKGRAGDVETLKRLGNDYGISVNVVDPVYVDGTLAGSSQIRRLIGEGNMEAAAKFLGRDYSLTGTVAKGYGAGKELGAPTANIDAPGCQLPGTGVYAAYADVDGERFRAVVNVGTNPTFDRQRLTVEAHLLDFNDSLYEKNVEVFFVRRLRDEKKFPTPSDLAAQIQKDVVAAKTLLTD